MPKPSSGAASVSLARYLPFTTTERGSRGQVWGHEAAMTSLLLFVFTFFILRYQGVGCMKLNVSIPQYKLKGESAVLECHFELEGDTLYSVKWYKESEEFYRFLPKSNPPQNSYKVEGVKVDQLRSNSRQVTLKGVTLKSTGTYRCEVSAEAPSFSSAQGEGRMEVVYLPNSGPLISGEQRQYQIGDEISLNCSSGRSSPASILHWFINDEQVTDPKSLETYPNTVHAHGLMTSQLGLRLRVMPQHFIGGSMRVRCVASVSPVLWQGDKESIVQRMSPLIDNREALLLVKGGGVQMRTQGWLVFLLLLFVLST